MSGESGGPDWILRLSFPSERRDLEDRVERVLFLSASSGSAIDEIGETTIVRLYYSSAELRDEAVAMIPEGIEDLEIHTEQAETVDWLDLYEHSLEPIEVGERWVVVPHERLLPSGSERIPLVIPQERAFGTGSHESTALCLRMLESLEIAGMRVVDVGTGSGILAIAMEKLGAARIVSLDNDVDTWGVVRSNIERNDVAPERISHFFGTADAIARGTVFDLVTMNIIPELVLDSLPEVSRIIPKRGRLVFSGILKERSQMVVDRAAACRLRLADHVEAGDWWCGLFAKS